MKGFLFVGAWLGVYGFANDYFDGTGDCEVTDQCIQSAYFGRGSYSSNSYCEWSVRYDSTLTLTAWDIETCCDKMLSGGYEYQPLTSTFPDAFMDGNIISPTTEFSWDTDSSIERSGWQICFSAFGPGAGPGGGPAAGTDSCALSNNGVCDESSAERCFSGTDCNDCSNCYVNNDCINSFDGICQQDNQFCLVDTDCSDCRNCQEPRNNTCIYANDGICQPLVGCPTGTDSTDCQSLSPSPAPSTGCYFEERLQGTLGASRINYYQSESEAKQACVEASSRGADSCIGVEHAYFEDDWYTVFGTVASSYSSSYNAYKMTCGVDCSQYSCYQVAEEDEGTEVNWGLIAGIVGGIIVLCWVRNSWRKASIKKQNEEQEQEFLNQVASQNYVQPVAQTQFKMPDETCFDIRHDHQLIKRNQNRRCDVCSTSGLGNYWQCGICNYDLCEDCQFKGPNDTDMLRASIGSGATGQPDEEEESIFNQLFDNQDDDVHYVEQEFTRLREEEYQGYDAPPEYAEALELCNPSEASANIAK